MNTPVPTIPRTAHLLGVRGRALDSTGQVGASSVQHPHAAPGSAIG
jgi:hypothetical protein